MLPVTMGLALAAADAGGQTRPSLGVIKGVVQDSLGAAVGFAEVSLVGSDIRAVADAAGRFRISGVPFGVIELRVRRLGYRPSVTSITFPPGSTPDVELRVAATPDFLPGVEVREQREVFDARLSGFKERSAKGVGHFVTRERLQRLHSYRFTDVLREIPSVRMRTLRGGGTTIVLRGSSCPPLVFVDGSPASAGVVDLDMFDLASVEGIEVYSGMASVPAEFVTGRGLERCGVVAIWSRPYRPAARAVVPSRNRSPGLDSLVSSMTVYTMDEVDTPAALIPGTALPEYPDSLRVAGVAGRVVVELVVNLNGRPEGDAVTLVSSTHPLFTGAVQQALADARFRVATLKSRPVRQIIRLPFVFKLDASASIR